MASLWIVLGVLVLVAGLRYRRRLHDGVAAHAPREVDDDAVRQILETGSWSPAEEEDDGPLDLDEAARAEEEFWEESWDEPEEYGP